MAVKQKRLSPEERLNKALADLAPFEAELHLLLPAQVWPFVEALCRLLLQHGTDRQQSRDLIAELALTCRQEALRKFGHDTLETFKLSRMLREGTSRWTPKAPRVDAITYINSAKHPPHRFTGDQDTAANDIRDVWGAFGKFLEVASRSIGGGGSARSQALGPVDVMGEDLWAHHRDVFKPWINKAARTVVTRRTSTGNHLSIAAIVFKVLVDDVYPEEIDNNYALIKGTALRAVKAGLDAYHNPDLLDAWGKPPPDPKKPGQGGLQKPPAAPGGTGTAPQEAPAAPAPAKRPPGLWQPPKPKLPPSGKVKLAPRKPKKNA